MRQICVNSKSALRVKYQKTKKTKKRNHHHVKYMRYLIKFHDAILE